MTIVTQDLASVTPIRPIIAEDEPRELHFRFWRNIAKPENDIAIRQALIEDQLIEAWERGVSPTLLCGGTGSDVIQEYLDRLLEAADHAAEVEAIGPTNLLTRAIEVYADALWQLAAVL